MTSTSAEPARRILHCDMDCFYAAVHMRDDPLLRGQPVVIGGNPEGRGVVAAASYEARAFGVRSAMPAARALRLCPAAVFLRPEFDRYRAESRRIFEIFGRFTEVIQPVSIDEAYLDLTGGLEEWGSATAAAREIKRLVQEERRLTVSVGVGPNRLVAKIASDFDKPDGLTVVPPRRVRGFLDPLPVRTLPGVGPATERRLKRLGIERVVDLRRRSLAELESRLGSWGRGLHAYAHGIDERPVRVDRERKSLSSERTYGEDLRRLEEMEAQIESLALRVSRGLRKREISASTFTLKVRYPDFTTLTRSKTVSAPTSDPRRITALARRLLEQTDAVGRGVRLLGVGASGLIGGRFEQLRLFEEPPG